MTCKMIKATALILVLLFSGQQIFAQEQESDSAVPSTSVYNLSVTMEDQAGKTAHLNRYQGQPVIATMFYASCGYVCPMLISTIKLTLNKLPPQQKDRLRVIAVTVDPDHDTPSVLMETAIEHSLDLERWSLLRPGVPDIRAIASVLKVKYKQLPNGEFNHSTRIVLLDAQGTEIASTEKLGRIDEDFLAAIRASMQ